MNNNNNNYNNNNNNDKNSNDNNNNSSNNNNNIIIMLFVLYSRFGVLEASCGRVPLDGRLDEPVPIDKHKGTYGCPRDKTVGLSQIHLKTVNNGNIYHNNNKQPGHYQ